jgi:hypothetical protein
MMCSALTRVGPTSAESTGFPGTHLAPSPVFFRLTDRCLVIRIDDLISSTSAIP